MQMGPERSLWATYPDESLKNEANEVEMEKRTNAGANKKIIISQEDFFRLLHSLCQL